MKHNLIRILKKWKRYGILTIGGLLIGAGFADCVIAMMDQLDLNQIARGLTIFSAGLTILVVMENSKTQKETEKILEANQLRLEKVEDKLSAIYQSQQMSKEQFQEVIKLLHK